MMRKVPSLQAFGALSGAPAQMRIHGGPHYQGIVTKPRIEPGFSNLENIVPQDCMAAKSDFPARLVTVETRGGPEPLPQNTPEAVKSW